jgi:hypothetical protein
MAPSSLAVFFEPATAVLFLGLALANFGVGLLISAIIYSCELNRTANFQQSLILPFLFQLHQSFLRT